MLVELINTNLGKKKWVGNECSQLCAASWDQMNKVQIWDVFAEMPTMVHAGCAWWTGSGNNL